MHTEGALMSSLVPMSLSKNVIHVKLAVVVAVDRYSASTLDLATIVYFFEFQAMQFDLRKM